MFLLESLYVHLETKMSDISKYFKGRLVFVKLRLISTICIFRVCAFCTK